MWWPSSTARSMGRVDDWDHEAHARDLQLAMGATCNRLQDLISAIPNWRLWALCDRLPMTSARQHAQGRVALLGDAAHPMRPYMAQGAGMAVEDAACLQKVLSASDMPMEKRLAQYAKQRWRRNARCSQGLSATGKSFMPRGWCVGGVTCP
ncbi:MAG: FAD-dependent monooxygenase [Burkholderiales bacterium]|nr:FAD-dependent monooxygenase [Burkholderiales bacterium]